MKYLMILFLCKAAFAITFNQAMQIPSVKEFSEQTALNTDKYLKKALKNQHWQNANKYFYGKTIPSKIGKRYYATLPYNYIIVELKEASKQGIVLASFQGYRYSSMISAKKGKYAKRDTAFFAKELMARDICLGYFETAYGYSRGWYSKQADWKSANKIMSAGKRACLNNSLPKWLRDYYARYSAQYKSMMKARR